MQIFCPNCGFPNSYQYTKPSTCRKCNNSLSFDSANVKQQVASSSSNSFELSQAERRLIMNYIGALSLIDTVKLMWGNQITQFCPEYKAAKDFVDSLKVSQDYADNKTSQTNIKQPLIKKIEYEEEEETTSNLPDLSSLQYTVEETSGIKSTTLENAIFSNPVNPADLPKVTKRKINHKKEFATIKEKYFPKTARAQSMDISQA